MWKADTELLEQSRGMLREALAALSAAPGDEEREEEAAILLEAAGTLVGLGAEEEARQLIADAPEARAACEAYLGRLDLTELEEAASELSHEATALMLLDLEESLELAHSVNAALERRDRLELVRMGADVVSPGYLFDAEQESAWLFFDERVGEELWRLLSLGDMRWVPAAWMKPDLRARFPWRTRGYGMGREALDALTDAAELLAHFPEARPHLEALIQTTQAPAAMERRVRSPDMGHGQPLATVINLQDYMRQHALSPNGKLQVAAADDGAELPIQELPGVEGLVDLDLRGRTLIAYLIHGDARAPRLEWMGGSLAGALVAGAEATYSFELPEQAELTLVIPVGDDERRVELRGCQ